MSYSSVKCPNLNIIDLTEEEENNNPTHLTNKEDSKGKSDTRIIQFELSNDMEYDVCISPNHNSKLLEVMKNRQEVMMKHIHDLEMKEKQIQDYIHEICCALESLRQRHNKLVTATQCMQRSFVTS
uniref:Uncharacterized protein n=1 Tax=Litopenaeus vannamei majanivirus Nimav-1_LVa TaxID=2984273 RepID=A0A9C7BH84_9VIRU|nr:MAG: hypothetical protein [Litopenaeus vannamei majanivirus Nimav-1_LVa]